LIRPPEKRDGQRIVSPGKGRFSRQEIKECDDCVHPLRPAPTTPSGVARANTRKISTSSISVEDASTPLMTDTELRVVGIQRRSEREPEFQLVEGFAEPRQ